MDSFNSGQSLYLITFAIRHVDNSSREKKSCCWRKNKKVSTSRTTQRYDAYCFSSHSSYAPSLCCRRRRATGTRWGYASERRGRAHGPEPRPHHRLCARIVTVGARPEEMTRRDRRTYARLRRPRRVGAAVPMLG
jgi:hypothetical protein